MIDEKRIADFFESLTTSKNFILLSDGNWDLRANHSVKIDMNDGIIKFFGCFSLHVNQF